MLRKQVRIISLGEIVTPDFMKTIQAFTTLIAKKKQEIKPVEVQKSIGLLLQQNLELINDFKRGSLNETDFTRQIIDSLKKTTDVELTTNEFDQAWSAMNPKLEQFAPLLSEAIEYNNSPKQQIIFISFTNPKDIRHLIGELKKSNISHNNDNDQLFEIGGIQLFTTYNTKQNKDDLIKSTIKRLYTKSPIQSALAQSMSKVLSFEKGKESGTLDIKYIRCVNSINDPILKEDLDKTNQEVEQKAEEFFVDTILWMKNEKTLSDVLCDSQIASQKISVAKL